MPFITFGHMQRHIRDNHPEHHQNFSNKVVTDKDIVLSRETQWRCIGIFFFLFDDMSTGIKFEWSFGCLFTDTAW
jgi:hypothetical protein